MLPSLFTRQVAYQIFVKQFYIVSTLMLVSLLTAGWILAVRPAALAARAKEESIQKNASALEEQLKKQEEMKATIAAVDGLTPSEREKITASILEKIDKPSLWLYFNTLAEESGMVLEKIDITGLKEGRAATSESSKASVAPVDIDVALRGSGYATLKRMLTAAEQSLPLMDIISFSFQPDSEVINIKVQLYVLPAI